MLTQDQFTLKAYKQAEEEGSSIDAWTIAMMYKDYLVNPSKFDYLIK